MDLKYLHSPTTLLRRKVDIEALGGVVSAFLTIQKLEYFSVILLGCSRELVRMYRINFNIKVFCQLTDVNASSSYKMLCNV